MSPRVLIVDDSLTVRMDLGELFQGAGFTASLARSVAEAWLALGAIAFDLVVLDVVLPDGDGIRLLAELRGRESTAATPVILLSSESEVRDRIRGLKTGADEYVGKPYDPAYLLARARQLLHRDAPVDPELKLKVLLIDDSPTFREALRAALEQAGYAVTLAETGEEGLRLAVDVRPHALIVDGILPGIDGRAVIQRIRADAAMRRTPCILLTASDDRHLGELAALDSGADAYVRKEDDLEVVLTRLGALLRSAGAQEAAPASLLGPKKVLAVDDSLTYLQQVGTELRQDGYEVVLAHSGEEALELLEVQHVDCILLDVVMPGLSGQETCRRIKRSPSWRDIPLIMNTAQEQHAAMIEGINAGADDYVTKSSEFDVLRARLRAQLRRKQFEDENRLVREQLLQKELEAAEARAARELADTRAVLLTELQQRNDDLLQAKHDLEEKNLRIEHVSRVKSQFLAHMSHELRTPLNSIIGFSEVLTDGTFGEMNDRQQQFVGHILESGRHLLRLINDLLDQSKIEAGRLDVQIEACSFGALAREVVESLRTIAERKGVQLTTMDPPAEPPAVAADPLRLKQVLLNLLSNAVKFTPRGGRVSVTAAASGDGKFVRAEVSDTGPGIAPDEQLQLFQPFTQLERTRADRASGTGLGLALSKQLVELMGGRIGVDSAVGRGAIFWVELPVAP